jgi:nucleoid-associated protein YgaU
VNLPRHTFRGNGGAIAGNVLWGRVIVWGAALLFAFFLGFAIGSSGGDGVSRAAYDEQRKRTAEAERKYNELQAAQAEQSSATVTGPTGSTGTAGATPDGTGTVQATSTPTPAPAEASGPASAQTYVVKSGDTLWTIAQKVYGDGALYKLIAEENGLTSKASLRKGQTLTIPPKPASDGTGSGTATGTASSD